MRLKVVLFALTGFGNKVLDSLMNTSSVVVDAVFTEKYDQPFPYYDEKQLINYCKERHITCYFNVNVSNEEGISLLKLYHPDLILVATFKQILRRNVLDIPKKGVVNFHPSLLPLHRGPCPTNAALLQEDALTGITVHYITEEIDKGNILLQKSTPISKLDNDGLLRMKLAGLAGNMVPDVIRMFQAKQPPLGNPQPEGGCSYAPKPKVEDGYLELANDINSISRKIRAYNPFPGTSFLIGEQRIAVNDYKFLNENKQDGIYLSEKFIDLFVNGYGIRLYKNNSEL